MTFARKEFSSRFNLNCFLGFRCSDILCTDKQRNARSDRLLNFILSFWLCETYFHKWFKNLHKLGSKFSTLVVIDSQNQDVVDANYLFSLMVPEYYPEGSS